MSHTSSAEAGAPPLRVLTFNLWGIFNSKMREERMKAFATKIDHYDVLLLQEQFSPEDFDLIFKCASPEVRRTYTFRRFRSSFYGSGCAVISRFPISQAFFHVYPLQGYPEMVLHGDFFANKGAAMVRVMVPVAAKDGGAAELQEVTLYTTHLVAVYQRVSQLPSWKCERYLPFRISQAISLANFIMSTSRPTDRIILGGDFNCSQRSLEVQTILLLLRRQGYDLQSVLPSPRAPLDAAMSEQEREQEQRLYTYSNRNAFNAMQTSYFKLLRLEADRPAQIDHIFFSRSAFGLCNFADCPDVGDPRDLREGPSGLVVFTKNVVHMPPKPTWYGSLWHRLLTGRCASLCGNMARQRGQSTAKSTGTAEGACGDNAADYYPLSDHYGVAALLDMRVAGARSVIPKIGAGTEARSGAVPPLTPDEARVVQTVTDFLDDCVRKLRSQVRTTRYIAVSSVLLIAMNMWVIWTLGVEEQARTAAVLEQVYNMAAASTHDTARVPRQDDILHSVKQGLGWASSQLQRTLKNIRTSTGSAVLPGSGGVCETSVKTEEIDVVVRDRSAALSSLTPASARNATSNSATDIRKDPASTRRHELCAIAKALTLRPLWASASVSCVFNIITAVVGTASLVIGTFQRAGNANVLEEQVRELRKI